MPGPRLERVLVHEPLAYLAGLPNDASSREIVSIHRHQMGEGAKCLPTLSGLDREPRGVPACGSNADLSSHCGWIRGDLETRPSLDRGLGPKPGQRRPGVSMAGPTETPIVQAAIQGRLAWEARIRRPIVARSCAGKGWGWARGSPWL